MVHCDCVFKVLGVCVVFLASRFALKSGEVFK